MFDKVLALRPNIIIKTFFNLLDKGDYDTVEFDVYLQVFRLLLGMSSHYPNPLCETLKECIESGWKKRELVECKKWKY